MKKAVFPVLIALGLGSAHTTHAQIGVLGNLVGTGLRLGVGAIQKARMTPEQRTAAEQAATAQKAVTQQATAQQAAQALAAERNAAGSAAPTALVVYRTPADKLPKQAAQQLTDLEAQLDRCHAAMLADAKAPVCTPEQRAAIQQAALGVARAKPGFDLHPYQQEMAFYMAEDSRRQLAASPASPAQ